MVMVDEGQRVKKPSAIFGGKGGRLGENIDGHESVINMLINTGKRESLLLLINVK